MHTSLVEDDWCEQKMTLIRWWLFCPLFAGEVDNSAAAGRLWWEHQRPWGGASQEDAELWETKEQRSVQLSVRLSVIGLVTTCYIGCMVSLDWQVSCILYPDDQLAPSIKLVRQSSECQLQCHARWAYHNDLYSTKFSLLSTLHRSTISPTFTQSPALLMTLPYIWHYVSLTSDLTGRHC